MPPLRLARAVERAARLRAIGQSWHEIALELNRPVGTVRHWPYLFREYWDQLTASHQRTVLTDASSEAVGVLRVLLRSEDDRIRRDAAKEILDHRGPLPASETPSGNTDLHQFADYLEGLNDDDLLALLGKKDVRELDGPEAGVGGAATPAGAE